MSLINKLQQGGQLSDAKTANPLLAENITALTENVSKNKSFSILR